MKIIPSESLRAHLVEQNVITPDGGFDIPDEAFFTTDKDVRSHPFFAHESEAAVADRIAYSVIWKFHGRQQNDNLDGADLKNHQATAALTREIVQMKDAHLPNAVETLSGVISGSSDSLGESLKDSLEVHGRNHAELANQMIDRLDVLRSDVLINHGERTKLGIAHHEEAILTLKLVAKWIGLFILLAALSMIFSIESHAQGTPVTANQPIGSKLHVVCDSGCSSSSSPTIGAAMPTTATPVGGTDGTNLEPLQLDGSFNLKVNCLVGCAGGSSTPANAFANPTTAGLSQSFNMMWNGTSWDMIKGDTTSGLWVNIKNASLAVTGTFYQATQPVSNGGTFAVQCTSGCAGGTSTPADTFANPTTAGLQMSFGMLWNGSSWDRWYGDKTNGAFVNVKNASLAVTGTFWQATQPVSGTFWQATQPVSGTFWQATQPSSVADGANVTLGAKADAKSTATDTTAVTIMQVLKEISAMEQAPASRAVTNAGTFATQATLAAETTKVIGTVNVAAGQTIGITANSSVNVAQINGVTPLMGAGNTGTGSPRVTISTDQAALAGMGVGATAAAVPANANYIAGTDGTNTTGYYVDPCQRGIKSYAIISMSTATTARFAAPAVSKKTYICSLVLVAAGADNVAIIEGTGGTCGTGTAGVAGGTTAATGFNLAANGGLTMGNGQGAVFATAGTNVDMCLITSASVQLSGHITFVQYP